MTRRRIVGGALAAALAVAAAIGCGSDEAPEAGASTDSVVSGEAPFTIPDKSQARVADYWSTARMRAAAPLGSDPGTTIPEGADVEDEGPEHPDSTTPCVASAGHCTNGEGAYAYVRGPGDSSRPPGNSVGKAFFTIDGKPWECSGSIVDSENGSVVWTAGHCVGRRGKFFANWIFVPGYADGSAPVGRWVPRPGRSTFSLRQWLDETDWRYDLGAVVVAPADGRTIADRAGSLGIAFDRAPAADEPVALLGYPGAEPFDGSDLQRCDGHVAERDDPPWPEIAAAWLEALHGRVPRPDPTKPAGYRVGCDMTGGSSGGPFLLGLDDGAASVISVVSNGPTTVVTGPYQGADARALWERAQAVG